MTERQATVAFLATILVLLAVMAYQVRRGDGRTALYHGARAVTAPVFGGVLGVAHGIRDAWRDYVAVVDARREANELRERIVRLEADRARIREVAEENRRLRELLDLTAPGAYPDGLVARVVADISNGPLRRALLVGRGTNDGVDAGWIATRRGVLVGRVVRVQRRTAEVMLVVDPDSGVAVRHQLDRYAGVLRGGNRGPARLEYVPRDHAVAVGDPLVTSGLDRLYPPGLLVGYVRELYDDSPLTWRITVAVAFDPDRLEEVLLVPPVGRDRSPRTEAIP